MKSLFGEIFYLIKITISFEKINSIGELIFICEEFDCLNLSNIITS